jgi:four helix bundle protein
VLPLFYFHNSTYQRITGEKGLLDSIRSTCPFTTSIGANIIEGKSASSKKDFIRYYEIALKSANETKFGKLMKETSELAENLGC